MQQAAGAAVEHQRRTEVLQVQLDEALAAAAADARAASDAHAMAAELEAEIEVLRGRESDARSSAEAARLQAASTLCQLAAEVQVWHVSHACARDRTPCGLGRSRAFHAGLGRRCAAKDRAVRAPWLRSAGGFLQRQAGWRAQRRSSLARLRRRGEVRSSSMLRASRRSGRLQMSVLRDVARTRPRRPRPSSWQPLARRWQRRRQCGDSCLRR